MSAAPWWERWPGRLEYELDALRDAGAVVEQDPEARRSGVVRLHVKWPLADRLVKLVVTFPDLYPYFRFEAEAPEENLPYHQHAHGKNLCLIGRETSKWEPDDTVAGLLGTQLPRVLMAADSRDEETVADVEEHQPEPFSEYYPYATPAIVVVDGSWRVPEDEVSGYLVIGLLSPHPSPPEAAVRGVVLEVQDNTKRPIFKADPALREAHRQVSMMTRWVRVPEAIREFDPAQFFERVRKLDQGASLNPWHPVTGGRLQLWGVHFPEEVEWREQGGKGWLFVARVERDSARPPKNPFGLPKRKGR